MRKIFIGWCLAISLITLPQAEATAQDCDSVVMQDSSVADTLLAAPPADVFSNHVSKFDIRPAADYRRPLWLFIVFVLQLFLIGYLRVFYQKSFDDLLKSVMSLNIAHQIYREQSQSMPVSAIMFNINFALSEGVFVFLVNRQAGWVMDSSIVTMLFFMWAVIVIYSLKYGSLKFVSAVFPFGNEVDYYNFNFFLVQKIMGLMLVPFNLLIAYAPDPLKNVIMIGAIVMIGVLIIVRSLKGFSIAGNLIGRNLFHFIVYICTLEIAPVCILVKVVVDG